ncbi:MAG: hypothetical protein ACHQQ3_06155 [Gemmatimonadales bacterium]
MPPGVLNVPFREKVDFFLHVGLRYSRQLLTHWPVSMVRALRDPYPQTTTDDELCSLFYDTSMAKLMCPTLDPVDLRNFAAVIGDRDPASFIKADFSAYSELPAAPGMYVAATVSLFRRGDDGRPHLEAILINGLLLTAADGDAWTLAKLFVQQGAGQHMANCNHIPLHFPLDTINAISKSVLPRDHVVSRLLAPHLRFSLSLNGAALYSQLSVLRNHEAFIYSTLANTQAAVYRLVRIGYAGLPGNSGYARWRFSPTPEPVLGDFGVFLDRYYAAMLKFTSVIAAAVPPGDAAMAEWADAIAALLPGFPGTAELRKGDLLARVLAKIIWSASVAHGADHHDYGSIPIGKIALRLRVPPPASRTDRMPAKLAHWTDAMRQDMARILFFREDTVTPLRDVRYRFDSPALQAAGDAFIRDLDEVDATMPVKRFIPLRRIPASIQF